MATRHKRTGFFRQALLGFSVLVFVGCSGGKGEVSGQVKFKGEPLPSGRVTFACQTGTKEVLSSEILNGRYTISGVPVGPVKIMVETFPPPAASTPPPTKIPGGIPPNIKGMPEPGTPLPAPGKYVAIPQRYSNLGQSGLSYTVTSSGQQEHDILLQP
jgi:hypothetical protein